MPSLAVFLGIFASFGGFLFGYDTGYIAGCKEMKAFLRVYGDLQADRTYKLSTGTDSLITSILSAGTFVGALAASTIGDRVGRRLGIALYVAVFSVGVALQTGGTNLGTFAAGRVLAGLGVGGTSVLVPVYQAECAPRRIRGMIVSGYQWFITVGLLIAAIVVDQTKNHTGKSAYQIPIGIQFVWGAILAFGLLILPESPRWLLYKGRDDAARASLARLASADVSSDTVTKEYDEIRATLEEEFKHGGGRWSDCLRQGTQRTFQRIITGMILQAFTQLSGINFIFYYGTSFFTASGISNPFLITIATNVVNVGMTIPGMLLVDRVGRRPMLLYGSMGMAVSQLIVAAVGVARPTTDQAAQKVLVAFVCIFIAHFASCMAPLSWIITSELPPYALRTKSMSLSTASNWIFNFAIGYATPYLVNTGPGNAGLKTNVFWIWGGCCLACFFFTYFMIPETKQLSLEQIDLLYLNATPRTSNKYRKELIDGGIHRMGGGRLSVSKQGAGGDVHIDTSYGKAEDA
ncbi:hypothetical protein CspeluHIS016_0405320 [Cutaneotrichosporon spelunceum]|uniref:Major facilitator superfamily (MFS) profile domain-containing protein n=1 Tax=Cutaneotrichosporon spelunceum TaxID=1672016 RepID=A0AAD3YD08_9TREE|nr:hypothetical protein CspeluHIS016_0405320 [Cutaneotrichosporon spelunceum]